jgi:hypothetical protein
MSKNQLAKKEPTQLAVAPEPQVLTQEILSSDIIIPRLLLMQGLSEAVSERKKTPDNQVIQQGDMIRSTTLEKLGDPDKPVEFVPLKMVAQWILSEKIGQKFEFRKSIPRTAANEDLAWEYKENGIDWRRTKSLDVYALLPQDVAAYQTEMAKVAETGDLPDLNKTLLPVVISFRSTSFTAGRTIATFFAQVRDALRVDPNVKSYGYTLPLTCYQDKNDKGSYYVFKVGAPKKLATELFPEAERWFQTMTVIQNVKVDESEADTGPVVSGTAQF